MTCSRIFAWKARSALGETYRVTRSGWLALVLDHVQLFGLPSPHVANKNTSLIGPQLCQNWHGPLDPVLVGHVCGDWTLRMESCEGIVVSLTTIGSYVSWRLDKNPRASCSPS